MKYVQFHNQIGIEISRTEFGEGNDLVQVQLNDRYSQVVYAHHVIEITRDQMIAALRSSVTSIILKADMFGVTNNELAQILNSGLSGDDDAPQNISI